MSEKPETWESQIVLFSIRVYVFIVIHPMASQMRFILILSVFYPFYDRYVIQRNLTRLETIYDTFVCPALFVSCPALTQNIAFYHSFIHFFVSRFICENTSFY